MPPLEQLHTPAAKKKWASVPFIVFVLALLPSVAAAQNGDRAGEMQPEVDHEYDVPAAPILAPEAELATFQLPPGYRIELCAADPLIHDPVDISFDASGRLWVVEMRGLMRDADGTNELDPVGSIATLSDTDGDGFFETRVTFADKLVLPRGICHGFGGVIAILPPNLVWMSDTTGDGVADKTVVIDKSSAFEAGLTNPEHAPNAPLIGLDNWLYLANHDWRYRRGNSPTSAWERERVPRRGQWGLSQDDWGRQIYNYNSTPLRGDRVPPHYTLRNGALGLVQGTNASLVNDAATAPSRLNTGVNRGYQNGTLRSDGRLANYTAACGPVVFRGTALAPEDRGSTFVCEPAANLVRRNEMTESYGRVSGQAVRNQQGGFDFLTSTDERFRPVNLMNGPDGALYVVDLYRGILQHRVFLTSFLRRQIEERELDKGIGLGRIWRIVHKDSARQSEQPLAELDDFGLVAALSSDNGWRRSTAQRELVQRQMVLRAPRGQESFEYGPESTRLGTGEQELARKLRAEFASPAEALQSRFLLGSSMERLHAGWVLASLDHLSDKLLVEALAETSPPHLLAQVIRLSEVDPSTEVLDAWKELAGDQGAVSSDANGALVFWQLAHSVGFAGETHLAPALLFGREQDPILRGGLLAGLEGRELNLYTDLAPVDVQNANPKFAFSKTVADIGLIVAKRGDLTGFTRLFELALPHPLATPAIATPSSIALLQGFVRGLTQSVPPPFEEPQPASLAALLESSSTPIQALAIKIQAKLVFGTAAVVQDGAYVAAIERGEAVYQVTCAACHQPNGLGIEGLAPPLADPYWLGKSDEELSRIVIEGISGKIEVGGKTWDLVMPPWAQLSDDQVADVLTYVLAQFGDGKEEKRTVSPVTVHSQRP